MKKSNLFLVAITLALVLVSCKPDSEIVIQTPDTVTPTTLVDFEGVTLNSNGIWNGSDLSGEFVSSNSKFNNSYFVGDGWASWSGFACSSNKDTLTTGYGNQYSVIAGTGALSSSKFALAYDSAAFICPANTYGNFNIKSIMINNSTYAYWDMKKGTPGVSKIFSTGDWFKLSIKGYKANALRSSIDVYLADFRAGKSEILKTWKKVDVSSLGQVDLVTFTFDSSDKGAWGVNTPKYVCIDNIEFTQTISTK
ncbi:MAG: DUF4465 domain-containing protein [Paludibacter sp.]